MMCVEEGSQPLGVVSGVPPDGALERYDLSGHTRLDAGTVMDVGFHYQRLAIAGDAGVEEVGIARPRLSLLVILDACHLRGARQWTGPLSQLAPVDSEKTRMCS